MTERIIALGDIHGCSKALATLVEAIQPTELDTLVFLGDYIDRGPDSRGVLDQIIALSQSCTVVPLLGNHEEMLLAALAGGPFDVQYWVKFVGATTLDSYGWTGLPEWRNAISGEHIRFLKRCRDYLETVSHFFVHAYYDPGLPLHQQKWSGLRWASLPPVPERHCSKVAIVGHTPQKGGDILDGPTLTEDRMTGLGLNLVLNSGKNGLFGSISGHFFFAEKNQRCFLPNELRRITAIIP